MNSHQFASELRPNNLLLIPDYESMWVEKTERGQVLHTCHIVLKADIEIIENLTAPKEDRKSYFPMYLRDNSFRFLGFVEDQLTGISSFSIPQKNILITWDTQNGLIWHENGVPLKHLKIRFAHQLQNYIYDTIGIELNGWSTEELRDK